MKVNDHFLCHTGDPLSHVPAWKSPNHGPALHTPRFIVLHYTGGTSAQVARKWLCSPAAKASAHLVVDRYEITQLVPFDQRAWHAGESFWLTHRDDRQDNIFRGLNAYSIGIEMVNPGRLQQRAGGIYRTRTGVEYPAGEVVIARHKHEEHESAWAAYPAEQEDLVLEACLALVEAYPTIEDVLGHDDIAPTRKVDPGPAWDMESFRSKLFGRA